MYTGLVSRQAVIEHLSKRLYETALNNVDKSEVYTDIAENRLTVWVDELPSVQPKEKTGKWKQVLAKRDDDGSILRDYKCTNCFGIILRVPDDAENLPRYCCMCGAKMEV